MTAPITPSLGQLRQEFRDNGVAGWLWPWLEAILKTYVHFRLVPRYNPAVYSPSGQWDDTGIHDLVQNFVVDRAIAKGALASALDRAENIAGVVAYLERALHNHASSTSARTIGGNIFSRLRDVLAHDGRFRRLAGFGGRSSYGLDDWSDAPPRPADAENIAQALRFFPTDLKWQDYSQGDRQSPGLRTEDLGRIAFTILTGTARLWTARQLMQVIRLWFDLGAEGAGAETSLEDVGALSLSEALPLETLVADDLARRAIESLSDEQRRVLRAIVSSNATQSVREIAAELKMSKSTVSRHQQAIAESFRQLHVTTPGEQSQVVSAAAKLLGA